MTRDTSIDAFRSILPQLSDKQAVVMVLLDHSHALTNSEIARELGWTVNTVTPRIFELRELGVVQAYGKRNCRVTGRKAYAWGLVKEGAGQSDTPPCRPKAEAGADHRNGRRHPHDAVGAC